MTPAPTARWSGVIFDVDDVFVDMDRLADAAVDGVRTSLEARLGPDRGRRVTERFREHYAILRGQLRSEAGRASPGFEALALAITRWQRGVLEARHPLKIWSRETLLAVALEREGITVRGDLVREVVDAYWAVLKAKSRVFDDAARAVHRLRARGVYVHLATNSDGNLVFDEEAETFRYDPAHSAARKASRLEILAGVGIDRADLTIGDPIGKPDPAFFTGVLEAVERRAGAALDLSTVVAVGDSYTDDIRPLLDLGVTRGVWLLRKRTETTPEVYADDPRVTVIRSLDELEPPA